jgi:hypothetical protein
MYKITKYQEDVTVQNTAIKCKIDRELQSLARPI